jgi:hypothetical protein
MSRFASNRRSAIAALALIVAVAAGACEARASTGAGAPQPVVSTSPAQIHALAADLRVAQDRHDTRAVHRIHARIVDLLGTTATREAQASYRSVRANLAAADAAHDVQARAHYRAQLRALCAGMTGILVTCDEANAR